MPEIRVIEPIIFAPAEKLRVCAYARVSSDSTDQRNSFASQVNYYTKYIQAHEGWTFVDIYADQGITGTSALKRDEFLRLMRDCRQGKIDRILVKSVSRFARNAQDCIEAVRELRQLGVTVYFEKEHINTANMSNEMFLSMMSAFAQEESISILEQNHTLHRLRAKECIDSAFFIAQSNELSQKISNLKAELKQYRDLNEYADFIDNTRLILTILDSPMPVFSSSVFRNIVSRITVTHETLRFQLVNGLELEEERISGG